MVVTEILPSDKYRTSQLEPSNGRPYATTAHISQLKDWKCLMNMMTTPVQILMMNLKRKDSNGLFGDESEMVSSVGEFISAAYRTTVLRQSSRLRPPRGQLLDIEIWILPFAGAKGIEVSYLRVHLSSSDLTSRLPLTLSDIEPLQYESRCAIWQ
ncbi:hypothetical protein AVEN_11301-1 [Araneus ventricosus]|uniref:Uncharacterized protein n=1 Tax=Araneus ventricosus TaxID=182803 RepID=A0A4Y2DYF2_ARAVE|nr:hypothetical protein AVEN_11301-1 [Araneus ventricosus]